MSDDPPARGRRPSRAGALIGLLVGLLGFALVAQVKAQSDSALPAARQEDLVRILDDLTAREDRLRREIGELEQTRARITSGTAGDDAALAEARRRALDLGVLAGTVPAQGPGIVLTVGERDKRVSADVLLDAVQELRGAGAEAMQISGAQGSAVRVGASSYLVDAGDGIEVDGQRLTSPYTLVAIGEPATLATALNIPGGVVDNVQQAGATVLVEERREVSVNALRRLREPEYARPAS